MFFPESRLYTSIPSSEPSVRRASTDYLDEIFTITSIGFGAAWGGMLVFDSLVFCMTLYKSVISSRRPNGENILRILMRDGELQVSIL